jgi:GH25 family lysozyme M1 (1,4-beta-N-acetylmuramidase)
LKDQNLGTGGSSVRHYKPVNNVNRLINEMLTRQVYAFPASAVITQDKKVPDVSFYQKLIDFLFMRKRTDAVIIRAGQNLWTDPQFIRSYTEARHKGMLRGIYWFYDDRVSPGAQAAIIASLIQHDLPEMEIWMDWERSYGGGFTGLRNVVACMQEVERLLPGVRVGMYTGYFWFLENSNAIRNAAQYAYLKNKPLWLAWYAAASVVRIPAPWTKLDLWQFGTPAEYWGQESIEIDMNYFNGAISDFYARYKMTEATMWKGRTNTTAKVWSEPGVGQIAQLSTGTDVTGDAPLGEYVYLRTPRAGYTKKIWLSNYALVPVVEPPPVEPPTEPPVEPAEYVADFDVTLTAPDGKRYAGTVAGLTLREVE